MKKAILVMAALLMVASGVAAVSAYEAHTVNVKCHVENALELTLDNVDDFEFGTIFPEEWVGNKFSIALSQSAGDELLAGNITSVNFTVYVEWKEGEGMTAWADNGTAWDSYPGYYNWLGDCLYIKDGAMPDATSDPVVGPPDAPPPSAQSTGLSYDFNGNVSPVLLYVYIDAPVFEGCWNPITDALATGGVKPSGAALPTWEIPALDPYTDLHHPLHQEGGLDLGIDIKIQVTDIGRPVD